MFSTSTFLHRLLTFLQDQQQMSLIRYPCGQQKQNLFFLDPCDLEFFLERISMAVILYAPANPQQQPQHVHAIKDAINFPIHSEKHLATHPK